MDELATPRPMTKRIAELLPTVDVLVLNRLGGLTGQWRFIDPVLGPDVVEHLRWCLVMVEFSCNRGAGRVRHLPFIGRAVTGSVASHW